MGTESKVRLHIRVRCADGRELSADPVLNRNRTLRARYAFVNDLAENHPEGVYYLRYARAGKRVWDSVERDPVRALVAQRNAEHDLRGIALGRICVPAKRAHRNAGVFLELVAIEVEFMAQRLSEASVQADELVCEKMTANLNNGKTVSHVVGQTAGRIIEINLHPLNRFGGANRGKRDFLCMSVDAQVLKPVTQFVDEIDREPDAFALPSLPCEASPDAGSRAADATAAVAALERVHPNGHEQKALKVQVKKVALAMPLLFHDLLSKTPNVNEK